MPPEAFSVTAVIPAYDEEARIASAIASVRAQSEPPEAIVVVDDGSRDRTAALARELGATVVAKANGGLASARNAGIRAARTPWVALLDADDHWYPEKLARCRAAYEAQPDAGAIFTDFEIVRDGVSHGPALPAVDRYRTLRKRRLSADAVAIDGRAFAAALVAGNFLSSSTLVLRRTLALDDLLYDETLPSAPGYHVSEDIEFYLRLFGRTDAVVVERVLADYQRHAANMSASAGRLAYGDVLLGARIAATPQRYAPGVADAFGAQRRAHFRRAATWYVRALEFAPARDVLRESLAERPALLDRALLGLAVVADSRAGRRASEVARAAWRSGMKPVLRRLRARRT